MIELSDYDLTSPANEGAELEIVDPVNFKPFETPIKFWVLGVDSDKKTAAQNRIAREFVGKDVSDDEVIDIDKRVYCELVTKIDGLLLDGKEIEIEPESIYQIFTKYDWLFRQVKVFVENRANFFTKPSKK